ncbi:diguanylate cyclase domain-containing protein [Hyphomonas sp.]|jgi:diguanylate cyclase (GGDEF)-like protein|uniref:diguanylate cyclase domain-containing protein n=1 Tax=Hyphomonas sp. TaxID=87 RepID=UPI0039E6524F
MSGLSAILIANIALALLAALILWHGSQHAEQLSIVRKQFSKLSSTEPVTDLPNRATLHDRLTDALNSEGPDSALMVIELDGFKVINDTLGHETGDELLRAVAMRMSSCLHQSDLLARVGNGEFAALIMRDDAESRAAQTA